MQKHDMRAWLQGQYCLSYGAVGTRVALIASEPITGQAGDWVAVPHNTALVVISEKVCPASACPQPKRTPGSLSDHDGCEY